MPEISAKQSLEEQREALRGSVAEIDEIFIKINPQDPEYLKRLDRDLENWRNDQQGKAESIVDFLRWREAQGL